MRTARGMQPLIGKAPAAFSCDESPPPIRKRAHEFIVARIEILCRRGGRGYCSVFEPHHQRLESVMTDRTVNNLPAATNDDAVRCLFAIELSKSSWIVAVNTPLADRISRHTVKAGDGTELIALMERIAVRVGRETGRRVEIVSCYEAGYDGFWLHRLLEAHGVRNYVIDPASLQTDQS